MPSVEIRVSLVYETADKSQVHMLYWSMGKLIVLSFKTENHNQMYKLL